MITIMGATGHTGKKITEALLKVGEQVRALGQSESKLAELKRAGAEVLTGDATDAAFLAEAFRGADAVYTLLPTDPSSPDYRAEQDRQGEAIVKAIRESGVRYVVALSSLGADLSEGTGVIAGLHAQEERLKRLKDTNVLRDDARFQRGEGHRNSDAREHYAHAVRGLRGRTRPRLRGDVKENEEVPR
jgi:uncharacterized protein YbjT (DUF2867 family)